MLMRGLGFFSQSCYRNYGLGFDDNKTLGWGRETGSRSALPIWKGFMGAGLKNMENMILKYLLVLLVMYALIDPNKGVLADENTQETFMEAYVEGTEPGVQSMMSLSETKDPDGGDILGDDDYYNNQ